MVLLVCSKERLLAACRQQIPLQYPEYSLEEENKIQMKQRNIRILCPMQIIDNCSLNYLNYSRPNLLNLSSVMGRLGSC